MRRFACRGLFYTVARPPTPYYGQPTFSQIPHTWPQPRAVPVQYAAIERAGAVASDVLRTISGVLRYSEEADVERAVDCACGQLNSEAPPEELMCALVTGYIPSLIRSAARAAIRRHDAEAMELHMRRLRVLLDAYARFARSRDGVALASHAETLARSVDVLGTLGTLFPLDTTAWLRFVDELMGGERPLFDSDVRRRFTAAI